MLIPLAEELIKQNPSLVSADTQAIDEVIDDSINLLNDEGKDWLSLTISELLEKYELDAAETTQLQALPFNPKNKLNI